MVLPSGFTLATALLVVVVGCLVLVGWMCDLPALREVWPGLATMKANTALAFVLAGGALGLLGIEQASPRARGIGLACALAVLALGALTLSEYVFGWNLGLDEMLFRDAATPARSFPGRMSPATALSFILSGMALVFLWAERAGPSQACALALALLSGFALTGYLYSVSELYRFRAYSSMALHTAISFALLAIGLLCARPRRAWIATVSSDFAGGRMARRLLVAAVAVPLVLGWLRLKGQQAGWYGTELGLALFALSNVVVFAVLIWLYARALNAAHEKVLHRERLYVVLSQCNQSIVYISERDPLFARVCEIAVDLGKFRMAWIGLADRETQRVKPVACAGADDGFLERAVFSILDEPSGQMPAAAAIREDRSVICNRVQSDPRMATLREEALQRGYRSAAAFPLHNNGDVIGSFVLYAGEPDFFDAEEVKLLEEVAGDISFALRQMESEAERLRIAAELKTIFDSVPAMIFYKDREHRLVRANAASLRAFGKPPEEVFGKTDAELGMPYAEQYARDEDEIAATGQPKLGYIEPFATPSGEVRWFQTDKIPLRNAAGNITGFIGLAVDITERRRAEEALRESEADFRASFFSTAVGQVQADPVTCRYLRVNPKFCEITGYTEQELLGMTFRELTHSDDRADDGAAHARMVSGEIAELAREKRYRRKDGSAVWVSINATIIRDDSGQPLRTLAVVKDITARKAAEEARHSAEAKYRVLVERSLVGIYIIQDDRYVYVNPKMTELLGFSVEELTSAPVVDFVVEEDRPMVIENIRLRLDGTAESIRYELRMFRKDGTIIHVDARGSRAEYDGRPAILGTFLDVTERRKLEEQLLQSQKMEAIGELAAGIAHDFNNLLTAIVGNTRLALDDLPARHPARISLREIDTASTRATDLVRRILTFSRQETPERKPIQLKSVVEEALKLLRATLPATIDIRASFTAGTPAVSADATQVHQVMMNLGTNASHAMAGRGVLEIGLTVIDVDAAVARASVELREGRYVRLSVSDDGCGMDRATLARIFEPFFTTKALGQGTGLGLSVVHGIMKTHDGAITAYSQPAKGTVFHLYFPALDVGAMETPVEAGPEVRGDGQRILFVDDEELLVNLATEMFTRLGYHVTAFTRPEQALAAFRAAPESFDLVVSDLSMPGMTGPELARELLQLRPGIPIIIATGYVRAEDAESVRGIGIRALMLKPNTVEEMGPMVHRLLMEGNAASLIATRSP